MSSASPRIGRGDRVRRRFRVGLVALVVYVLFAAVIANLLTGLLGPDPDAAADFAVGHFPVLPVVIAAGLVFAWRSGWWHDIWREPSVAVGRPRRWWWLLVPALLLVQAVIVLASSPWSTIPVSLVIIVALGTALVGIGEELYVRGVLIVSLRGHHSEIVVLLGSSVLFGLAHIVTELWQGLPLALIAFQVAFLTMDGALYYAVRRSTGRLWVAMALHALTDFSLYLQSGGSHDTNFDVPSSAAISETALVVLSVLVLFSVIRETVRTRRPTPTPTPTPTN